MLAGVAAVGTGFGLSSGPTDCSADDPTICGPDVGFAWAVVLLVASVVLLWWRPVLACLCGLVFSLMDLAFDEVQPARVTFGVYAVGCAAAAVWFVARRSAQSRMIAQLTNSAEVSVPPHTPVAGAPDASDRLNPWDATGSGRRRIAGWQVVAVALLLGAVLSGAMYRHQQAMTAAHVARSVRVQSEAEPMDDGSEQEFLVLTFTPGAADSVFLSVLGEYAPGTLQPLLVDPTDPDWGMLVAEPEDNTSWLTLAIALLAASGIVLVDRVQARIARRRLLGESQPAVAVRCAPGSGRVWVLPSGEDVLVAGYRPDAATVETVGDPVRAVLLGALRDRGWAALLTDDGVVLPRRRLRTNRTPDPWTSELATRGEEDKEPGAEDGAVEVALGDATAVPALPHVIVNPPLARLLGGALLVGVAVGGPLAVRSFVQDWVELAFVVSFAAGLGSTGADRLLGRVTLRQSAIELESGISRQVTPWAAVRHVYVTEYTIRVATDDDVVELVVPESGGDGPATLAAGIRSLVDRQDPLPADRAPVRTMPSRWLPVAVAPALLTAAAGASALMG